MAKDHFRRVACLQSGPGHVTGLCHAIADERVSEGILTPSTGNLRFHGHVVQRARIVGDRHNWPSGLAPGGEPCLEVVGEDGKPSRSGLGFSAGDLDVTTIPLDVLPIEAVDFCRPDAREGTDGKEGQNAFVGGEQEAPHFIGGEDGDVRFLLLELLAQLGGGLPIGMEVALLLGEAEHGHDVAPDAVLTDRPQVFQPAEVVVDVRDFDLRDLARHRRRELFQMPTGARYVGVTHPLPFKRGDELGGDLCRGAVGEPVRTIGDVEPNGIGE